MENLEEKNSNELKVSDVIKENITSGMKWAKFLTILMCIGVVLMILCGVLVFAMSSITASSSPATMGIMGLFYILIALIYIYPIKLCFAGIRNVNDAFQYEKTIEVYGYCCHYIHSNLFDCPLHPLYRRICIRFFCIQFIQFSVLIK